MSLLMDALRKAEADKKQASTQSAEADREEAHSAGETSPDAPTREFRVPAYSELADTVASVGESPLLASSLVPPSESSAPSEDGAELSLEPLEPFESDAELGAAELGILDENSVGESEATATSPSVSGDEAALDPVAAGPPAPAQSPASATKRIPAGENDGSGIAETVATAQTVFATGARGPSNRVILWGVLVAIVIGCVMTGAGFYYFQQAPTAHEIPSPSVAVNVERSPPKELPIVALDVAPEVPPAALARIEPSAGPAVSEPREGIPAEVLEAPGLPVAAAPIAEVEHAGPLIETAPASDATPVASPAAPEIGVRPGELRIARNAHTADTNAMLSQAYAAYVAGRYGHAEELYQRVLDQRPHQRDAQLGIAALRLRDGEVAAAHRLYREVLKRDPDNPTASAALFSIEGGSGERVTESRLKLLLDDGADAGYIYFSLGNLYARNKRWPDAQQAYFEALRNNPMNPDYNYNLAVSLDRIGQRESAAKYYDAAVTLIDSGQAGFDPANALARIQAINSAGPQ